MTRKFTSSEQVAIYVNQNLRDGYVLAILEDEALIEYEMPKGSTALRIVPNDQDFVYSKPHWYKSVSYTSLSTKWLKAMYDQDTINLMIANPQGKNNWLDRLQIKKRIESLISEWNGNNQ